jgi:hypothetical protein
MYNVLGLPTEVAEYIFTLTEEKPNKLALVSKGWNDVIQKMLIDLVHSYEKNEFLRPHIEFAKRIIIQISQKKDHYLTIQIIKFIFQDVITNPAGGLSKEPLCMKTLSVAGIEANALTNFAFRVPELRAFVKELEHKFSSLEKVENIRIWMMQDHKKKLAEISELNLSGHKFIVLPKEIKYFTGLTRLDLFNNRLSVLPKEMKYLTGLKRLCLSYNQLSTLPCEIGLLAQLEFLNLSNNQLTDLPSEIRLLTQLGYLNLSNNQLTAKNPLTALLSKIGLLPGLRTLNLSKNQLSALSSEIKLLTQLQTLDLSNNQLNALPSEIGLLTQLLDFDLSHNQLSAFPNEIESLLQLQKLNLSNNRISIFPELTHFIQRFAGGYIRG